jgi:hypothetical protein
VCDAAGSRLPVKETKGRIEGGTLLWEEKTNQYRSNNKGDIYKTPKGRVMSFFEPCMARWAPLSGIRLPR